jgi:hypothetical protein
MALAASSGTRHAIGATVRVDDTAGRARCINGLMQLDVTMRWITRMNKWL